MTPLSPWTYAEGKNEHANQVALFMWLNMASQYGFFAAFDRQSYEVKDHAKNSYAWKPVPELQFIHAIHNQGHGDKIRGAKAKSEGVKAGVPDIFVPIVKLPHYCGLYIELKTEKTENTKKGSLSDVQKKWIDYLKTQGYKAVVCYGWMEAAATIQTYVEQGIVHNDKCR